MNRPSRDQPSPSTSGPERGSPLTGADYWVPRPGEGGVAWGLATCHDLQAWDAISHREFWPLILEVLAKEWDQDIRVLIRRLHDYHTGLPRGRIVHPKSGYVVIHGDDAPVTNWLELVKAGFGLTEVKLTPEFTEHEMMTGEDPRVVHDVLGLSLPLKTTP